MMPTSWDALFKEIFTHFFRQMNLQTKTQQEVSRQPLTIDTIVFCQDKSDMQKLQATAFHFFRFHNLLEFKSSMDRLTISDYHRVLARARLYLSENTKKLSLDDIILCVISSSKPRSVMSQIPQITFTRVEKGHYVPDELIPTHIYVLSELPVEERYYPLLLFSSGKKRREFLREIAEKNKLEYIRFAALLYPKDIREVYTMRHKEYPTIEENIQTLIEWFGARTFLKHLTPEEIIQNLDVDQRKQLIQKLAQQNDGKDGKKKTSNEE
ncbi:MAG: hypothetical protein ACE5PV_10810 [Candidatus Poribacteria bacterium]